MQVRPVVWMGGAAIAAALVLGAIVIRSAQHPDGPTVAFRLEEKAGVPVEPGAVERTVGVLERRFDGAGLAGIEVAGSPEDRQVVLTLPSALEPRLGEICALAERSGSLEFRIAASQADDRRYREVWEQGRVKPPPEFAWFPQRDGGPDRLVETPEKPFERELARVSNRDGAASPETKAAREKCDEVQRSEVFPGDQLVRAWVQRQTMETVVGFEFRSDRKPWFGKFTEKHVNEPLAIIVDGKVCSAPHIKSKLPGEGIIMGGGATGFTEDEAASLAIVLASGPLPCRLVRIDAKEAK